MDKEVEGQLSATEYCGYKEVEGQLSATEYKGTGPNK